ncbi:aldehyde dehydrogenase family protein [Actinosynnema mirum]|uniref:Aldehyde dehydrogenase n=1 Tax=Actinosynnema mirum (strain ATCC 29888 / DSM 43827 / JCM 3225 / NBRC 14064 / NCIMB 13271 / NRRL B-12336 / IMRU 3971 / 101) TaxID=446462 RepID=C6WHH3_ACTMD|nr:aldehyde dehydrogenase family protein [Actinosynnema mirum]ACU39922.1 aldehyde dehydrogenase [Actinosynnema mirum DSM 43827]
MTQTAEAKSERGGDGPELLTSHDPRTGEVVGRHPVHSADDVAAAVRRARDASTHWAALDFDGRRARLDRWRKLLSRRADELCALISAETGKSADDARLEVAMVLDHLHWAAKHARKTLGRRRVATGPVMHNHAATLEYRPFGVVGVIGPWNYPAFTPMGSLSYALAAGNAVVFKPSEHTPGVGRFLADTFAEAVPEQHVLQVVTGYGPTGAALCGAGVDKLAFTGSTATGRRVMAECARTLTPVLVECGGKDALIVAEDADLEAAARGAVWGGLFNAGQSCAGVERVYVAEAVADAFVELVTRKAATLRPGGSPDADFGPITMPKQVDVIAAHVADALDRGATAAVGGRESIRPPYVEPVVLLDVPEDAAAVTEETFGPTLVVNRVADADEAVRRANALRYGLGAAVYSKARGEELAARLRCGVVSINSVLAFASVPALPFGGVGDSGFGRIHGEDGLREFTYAHAVSRQRFAGALDPMTYERGNRTVRRVLRLVRVLRGR